MKTNLFRNADDFYLGARPRQEFPPPPGDTITDALVIGGGLTGLLVAHFLRAHGVDCAVIEAGSIGGGSSGRSGGILTDHMESDLIDFTGPENSAVRQFFVRGVQGLSHLISTLRLDCDFDAHLGALSLVPATKAKEEALTREYEFLKTIRANQIEMLDQNQLGQYFRPPGRPLVAILDRSVHALNPAKLVLELASNLVARGVKVFENCFCRSYDPKLRQAVINGGTRINFNCIIFANGEGAFPLLPPDLSRKVHLRPVALSTYIFATEVLSEKFLAGNFPGGRPPVLWTDHFFHHYIRFTKERRLLFGGAGAILGCSSRTHFIREPFSKNQFEALLRDSKAYLPNLSANQITHFWGGVVSPSAGGLPVVGMLNSQTGIATCIPGLAAAFSAAELLGKVLNAEMSDLEIPARLHCTRTASAYERLVQTALKIPGAPSLATLGYRITDLWRPEESIA